MVSIEKWFEMGENERRIQFCKVRLHILIKVLSQHSKQHTPRAFVGVPTCFKRTLMPFELLY